MPCDTNLKAISWVILKPDLYFSRRLSAAVAYSFVARAGNYGRHRQLLSKFDRALHKYKKSPERTTKWSIHGIQIQMRIQMRIQISLLTCIYTEKLNYLCASLMAHTLLSG